MLTKQECKICTDWPLQIRPNRLYIQTSHLRCLFCTYMLFKHVYDSTSIRFECAWLTELGGGVEQHTVIKERRVPLQQLPTSDAPVVDAVVEVAG